jgi:proteasome assembly chaperone (PAC2) family protein
VDLSAIKDRLIEAAAAAALLGGGAQIITNTVDNAKQDTRIERVEKVDERLEQMQDDLTVTREAVVRLEAKMENTP